MKKEIISCDIQGEHNGKISSYKNMTVVFVTEQNEGRTCEPYFDKVDIDICEDHLGNLLQNRVMITAEGAMGYNKYFIE